MCESKNILSVDTIKAIGRELQPNSEPMGERQAKQFADILADLSAKQLKLNISKDTATELASLSGLYASALKHERTKDADYLFNKIKTLLEK